MSVSALAAKAMIFYDTALFEFGKADLTPEGKEKIKQYRDHAKEELSRADKVKITGYTDNVGEPASNATLSQQRAAPASPGAPAAARLPVAREPRLRSVAGGLYAKASA